MSDLVIGDYTAATTIDGTTHFLLIQPGDASTAYKKISRNVLLAITGSPVGTTDSQAITNKTIGNTNTITLKDTLFTLQDDGDITKQARFQLSGITTATTRTYTLPNASSTLADIATAQTFTNKTLTNPVITGGSIDNTTITVDTIAGHTASTTGTVYGISVTSGTIGTAALANASVTASKLATSTQSSTVNTGETTTSTSYVALTTAQAITVTVGANGILLVFLCAQISNSGANTTKMSFALSGANTLASSDNNSIFSTVASASGFGGFVPLTGLNAGSTTVTAQFAVSAGTGTFDKRRITALPL